MTSYFTRSEFYKNFETPPDEILEKIDSHIIELNPIRLRQNEAITITSGYRPREHELLKGRSGNSQHTFHHRGACDLVANSLLTLLDNLVKHSSYSRICYYPKDGFIHVDWVGWVPNETKQLFVDHGKGWRRIDSFTSYE